MAEQCQLNLGVTATQSRHPGESRGPRYTESLDSGLCRNDVSCRVNL